MRSVITTQIKNSGLIAVLAIALLSLVGGSAVASGLLTSKDVKNGSLTGKDIKNKSIGTADLSKAALAGIKGDTGPTGPAGPAGSHAPVGTVATTSANTTSSTAFVDVPGMSTVFTSPAGTTKLILNYSAECSVTHATLKRWTSVRILVDGVESTPASGINYAFCSNVDVHPTDPMYVGADVQRVINVAPGPHNVQVQFAVSGIGATARLDDDILTVVSG